MKLELSSWNEPLNGEMSLENIRQLYQPENQYRVSWNTYPSGTNFNGWSRDKRLYIIHGCCSVTIKDISFNLCSGEFADFPEGDYQFKVISDSAIDLVSVWEIPEEIRVTNDPFWHVIALSFKEMKKVSLTVFLILILNCFSYSQAYWEGSEYISDGVRQPLIIHSPKEEAKILKDRWQAIGEELKTTDSLFAGTYVKSGYRGWYLRWSPQNGFVYIFHYEDIDVIDYSYGKVEVDGSEVSFIPEREMQKEFNGQKLTTPKNWLIMGANLIPKEKVKDFADYRSGLGNYNVWDCECMAFFSKSFPKKAPRFIIPNQYKNLFRPPIEGKIVFAGKQIIHKATEEFGAFLETPVRINVGTNKGVKKEMNLRTSSYGRIVEITKVKPTYSEGKITDSIWEEEKSMIATYYDEKTEKNKPLPPVRVGTKVTTKLFFYY